MQDSTIKSRFLRLLYFMALFGMDLITTLKSVRGLPAYCRDLMTIKRQLRDSQEEFSWGDLYPRLSDRFSESGIARGHYFHQDLLVARRIFANNPVLHVDVGSRIDGFVAHVASFRFIEVLDVRPMEVRVTNMKFVQCDLMGELPASLVNYCDSLSCLHVLEHFGLGRYGDPVNANGHILGFENLHKILKVGGKFYFSVPIGPQRIEFNGHRVFSVEYLLNLMGKRFVVDFFSFVDDKGDLFENVELTEEKIAGNFGCNFGCGIFELTKDM